MNGYISININGQPTGIKFNYKAIGDFFTIASEKKDSYYIGEDRLSYLGMAKLIQLAYNENCVIKEQEPSLSLENFFDFVENAYLENVEADKVEIKKALDAFNESKYVKILTEDLVDNTEAKKKTSQGKLKKSNAKY